MYFYNTCINNIIILFRFVLIIIIINVLYYYWNAVQLLRVFSLSSIWIAVWYSYYSQPADDGWLFLTRPPLWGTTFPFVGRGFAPIELGFTPTIPRFLSHWFLVFKCSFESCLLNIQYLTFQLWILAWLSKLFGFHYVYIFVTL